MARKKLMAVEVRRTQEASIEVEAYTTEEAVEEGLKLARDRWDWDEDPEFEVVDVR